MTDDDLRIWPTTFEPDDAEGSATPDDCYEVVDITGEGNTLFIGSLAECRRYAKAEPCE